MIEHIKLDDSANKELFAFPYGIDDFLIFASCLKKYKQANKDKKIFLLVLAPKQPAFEAQSFIKELAQRYYFIDNVYEMEDIVITKNDKLVVDKKKIEAYIRMYSNYIKFDKVRMVEFNPLIKKDDYRYNIYFQSSTLLGLPHEKPEYFLPDSSEKADSARKWLKDHGINDGEKYGVVQLKRRFQNKTVHFSLYEKAFNQLNLSGLKIVEMNGNLVKGSVNLRPEEVTNLTTLEIIKGADVIIGNISYAFQVGGMLNKKTVAIVNPQTPALIRDYCFNFAKENIVFLALDGTMVEWQGIRDSVPFVQGNDPYAKDTELKLKEINFYNPKQQKNKLTKLVIAQKEKFKAKLKSGEKIEPPLIWYQTDVKCLTYGGYDITKDHGIKFQALDGLPQLLAYEELDYDKVKVRLTNVYKAFS